MSNLETFLQRVRSGDIKLVNHYIECEKRAVMSVYNASPDEILVAREHYRTLFILMFTSDVSVCMDTVNHSPFHHTGHDCISAYTHCTACARKRNLTEPTDEEVFIQERAFQESARTMNTTHRNDDQ